MFSKFTQSVYLNLITGLILLATSFYEILHSVETVVGTQHGVFIFAIVHILKTLPDIMHGMEAIDEGEKLNDMK